MIIMSKSGSRDYASGLALGAKTSRARYYAFDIILLSFRNTLNVI